MNDFILIFVFLIFLVLILSIIMIVFSIIGLAVRKYKTYFFFLLASISWTMGILGYFLTAQGNSQSASFVFMVFSFFSMIFVFIGMLMIPKNKWGVSYEEGCLYFFIVTAILTYINSFFVFTSLFNLALIPEPSSMKFLAIIVLFKD